MKNTASAKVASVSPRRQPLAFGNAIEVGGVPQPRRLLVQRLDEMRMGMTERIHRNARAEIEILAPIFGGQSRPLPAMNATGCRL